MKEEGEGEPKKEEEDPQAAQKDKNLLTFEGIHYHIHITVEHIVQL